MITGTDGMCEARLQLLAQFFGFETQQVLDLCIFYKMSRPVVGLPVS
jgi:hypothetical protein